MFSHQNSWLLWLHMASDFWEPVQKLCASRWSHSPQVFLRQTERGQSHYLGLQFHYYISGYAYQWLYNNRYSQVISRLVEFITIVIPIAPEPPVVLTHPRDSKDVKQHRLWKPRPMAHLQMIYRLCKHGDFPQLLELPAGTYHSVWIMILVGPCEHVSVTGSHSAETCFFFFSGALG